jgi:hypothetical protein
VSKSTVSVVSRPHHLPLRRAPPALLASTCADSPCALILFAPQLRREGKAHLPRCSSPSSSRLSAPGVVAAPLRLKCRLVTVFMRLWVAGVLVLVQTVAVPRASHPPGCRRSHCGHLNADSHGRPWRCPAVDAASTPPAPRRSPAKLPGS